MKNVQQILLVLCIIFTFMLGIYIGITVTQNEYEKRALEVKDKDCYSIRDIEYILFKGSQE